jgi:hypothetical protein
VEKIFGGEYEVYLGNSIGKIKELKNEGMKG